MNDKLLIYNVLIRPLKIEDVSVSFHWRNDPEIWKYTATRPDKIITEKIEKEWLAEKLNESNSSRFAITVDDQYVGNVQITDIIESDAGQYHIFIGEKSFWGKGIAEQATAQIVRFAREKLKLKRLYLNVNPDHISAIRLFEKSGFVKVNDEIRMNLNLIESKIPVVSVFVITFNHEQFIGKTLDGILVQKTNFDFDIVVGEDCSTDNTRKMVMEYAEKFPGKFKLLLHDKNIGAMANQIATLKTCNGKYIALCEGDDYWTYPYKLQEQVDFLKNHKQYSMCFTGYSVVDSFNQVIKENLGYKKDLSHGEIFSTHCPPTASVLFRSETLNNCLDLKIWYDLSYGDHTLFAFITRYGKAKSLNGNYVNYRVHKEGKWSQAGFEKRLSNSEKNFEIMKNYFTNPGEIKAINKGILNIKRKLLHYYLYNKEFKEFKELSFEIAKQHKIKGLFKLFRIYLYLLKKIVFKIKNSLLELRQTLNANRKTLNA